MRKLLPVLLSLFALLVCTTFASAQHRGNYGNFNRSFGYSNSFSYGSAAFLYQQPYQLALPIVQTYSVPVVQQVYAAPIVQQVYAAPVVQAAPIVYQAPQVFQAPAPVVYQQAIVQPSYAPVCATVGAAFSPYASLGYASSGLGYGLNSHYINRLNGIRGGFRR